MKKIMYCIIFSFLFVLCFNLYSVDAKVKDYSNSVFSWDSDYMLSKNFDRLDKVMKELDCSVIYQSVPRSTSKSTVKKFLEHNSKVGNSVWYLTGDSSWATEDNAKHMKDEIKRVASLNKSVSKKSKFRGIVFDVEPYVTSEWKQDKKACMIKYVKNCSSAYKLAKKNNLKVILCIPFHYDNSGLNKYLEKLIKTGCDGVAVMNYNKNDEVGQIKNELTYAKKYNKFLLNIVEMQRPGTHDLTDNNTYYNDGISGAKELWRKIRNSYKYSKIGFSWHYLSVLDSIIDY